MKKSFIGYYTPTESEFGQLWSSARIVVDANVLLAVYGLSPSTRDTLLAVLEIVRERLWIPNQFALEFQRNRVARILEEVKHYEDARRNLKSILDDQFRSRTRHPFVSEGIEKELEGICENMLQGKMEQEKLLSSDPHFAKITQLFEGRVGAPYNENDLGQAYDVARKRFSERVPPGYKDSDKPEPERYGDYVGWRQILDFATKNQASVILVTDDTKEDWWRREGAQTFGPRPELVAEFRGYCSGLFYMYSSDRFLEQSIGYIGALVDLKAINELKERRESEPSQDVQKPIISVPPDLSVTKPTVYIPEPDSGEAKQFIDTARSTGQVSVKPEEE